jgi:formate dehydrogenase
VNELELVPGDSANITATRICPLREACCGLTVEIAGSVVSKVRPNQKDVFSRGYACPKGLGLAAVADDPDRLMSPLVRRGLTWEEASWEDAFGVIAERLPGIVADGPDACGVYLGNPYSHNLDLSLYGGALFSALRTRNLFSAASVDSMPKHLSSGLMFGSSFGVPVPDIPGPSILCARVQHASPTAA